jgi:hypothetical protein
MGIIQLKQLFFLNWIFIHFCRFPHVLQNSVRTWQLRQIANKQWTLFKNNIKGYFCFGSFLPERHKWQRLRQDTLREATRIHLLTPNRFQDVEPPCGLHIDSTHGININLVFPIRYLNRAFVICVARAEISNRSGANNKCCITLSCRKLLG